MIQNITKQVKIYNQEQSLEQQIQMDMKNNSNYMDNINHISEELYQLNKIIAEYPIETLEQFIQEAKIIEDDTKTPTNIPEYHRYMFLRLQSIICDLIKDIKDKDQARVLFNKLTNIHKNIKNNNEIYRTNEQKVKNYLNRINGIIIVLGDFLYTQSYFNPTNNDNNLTKQINILQNNCYNMMIKGYRTDRIYAVDQQNNKLYTKNLKSLYNNNNNKQ